MMNYCFNEDECRRKLLFSHFDDESLRSGLHVPVENFIELQLLNCRFPELMFKDHYNKNIEKIHNSLGRCE